MGAEVLHLVAAQLTFTNVHVRVVSTRFLCLVCALLSPPCIYAPTFPPLTRKLNVTVSESKRALELHRLTSRCIFSAEPWKWDSADSSTLPLILLEPPFGMGDLYAAVQRRSYEDVEQALVGGADPNKPPSLRTASSSVFRNLGRASVRGYDGLSPLHIAASLGPSSIVQLLLKWKAGVNATDNYGRTPLHLAARSIYLARVPPEADDDEDAVQRIRILVTAGANVDAPDAKRRTPLLYALLTVSTTVKTRLMNTLLQAGANVHIRYDPNRPLLHDLTSIEKGLKHFPIPIISRTIRSVLEALLDEGADITGRDDENRTALHLAAQLECPATLSALIDAGENIHACTGEEGDTPLHLIARNDRGSGVCELLIEAGADPTRRNRNGDTPISLAVTEESQILQNLLQQIPPKTLVCRIP